MKELENILKSIKNKTLQPIYFLHGEEPYFIDIAIKSFENNVLSEDERSFNQTVAYGKDTSYLEILSLARQFPMMGDKQLIIVKEAQDLKMNEENAAAMLIYSENPNPTTILVFAHKYKKVDSRKKFVKVLTKNNWIFQSESIKDYKLAPWIQSELQNYGIKTTPNIPVLLAEYLGNNLSRISNELNKLRLILRPDEVLDNKLVELHIGISKDYNIFELQKALGLKNYENAMKIAFFMGKNMKITPLVLIVGNLYNFFSNVLIYHALKGQPSNVISSAMGVNPYFLKDYELSARFYPMKHATRIISILREIDLKSKGLGTNNVGEDQLLKELVYKIVNIDKTKVLA